MGCLPVVRASLGRVTRAALLRLGRGSTGECPHLAERQLTSGHSIGDEWQMLECTSGPDLLLRRVACDTDLPCEPLPARREAFALPVPVSIRMEPRAGDLEAALQNVSEMEAVLDAGGIDRPRLLHGFRATAWPLIEEAARLGTTRALDWRTRSRCLTARRRVTTGRSWRRQPAGSRSPRRTPGGEPV